MPILLTLDEANALLPRIASGLRRCQQIRDSTATVQSTLHRVQRTGYSNGVDLATKVGELRHQIDEQTNELKSILQDILDLGCEIKDIEHGLVDFQSLRDGRVIYLCWQLGEEKIQFWHELSEGFAGRQPL